MARCAKPCLKKHVKAAEVTAIDDGFRHSFGTYHLALHEDANKTANQMGHRGNTNLVFSHYRKLVPKEDGTASSRTATIRRSIDGFENASAGLTDHYEGAKTMRRKTPAKKPRAEII